MEVSCVICKESSPETIIVSTDKGWRTLVLSSLEWQDGLHNALESTKPQRILEAFQKRYIHISSISSAKRIPECLEKDDEAPNLWSSVPRVFDIKIDCLICSEPVSYDIKHPQRKRKSFSNVETLEFHNSILQRAQERNDEWGSEVITCLQHERVTKFSFV